METPTASLCDPSVASRVRGGREPVCLIRQLQTLRVGNAGIGNGILLWHSNPLWFGVLRHVGRL
nr:MAG TPA: hypothetical protein [Caudoviricetes sp.]